jgi:hypothetical protein
VYERLGNPEVRAELEQIEQELRRLASESDALRRRRAELLRPWPLSTILEVHQERRTIQVVVAGVRKDIDGSWQPAGRVLYENGVLSRLPFVIHGTYHRVLGEHEDLVELDA